MRARGTSDPRWTHAHGKAAREMRLYYWIHHTGSYERNTGVQRVVRNLATALVEAGHELVAVRWAADREAIVRAERAWLTGLGRFDGPVLPAQAEEGVPLHLS